MRIKLSLVGFIFLLISLIVLFSEPNIINYFVDGHHSWVSLHSLAIVKNTNFNTGFVGYTCKNISLDGTTNYLYFNRYPVFFALIAKFILSPWQNNTESYLYFARQLMNIIYLINLLFLYKISRKFSFSRFASIASVLITGSSIHWLYYKNIFHFDQPALLAFTILIYLLIDLKLLNSQGKESINNKKFYFYVFLLLLIGRSINIIFFIFSCLILAFYSKKSIFFKIRKQLLIIICFGILILLANLIYNISIESFINNINWRSTSIIDSLLRRIELIKVFDFNNHSILEIHNNKEWFSYFIPRTLIDILFFFSPLMAIIFSFHAFILIFNLVLRNCRFTFYKYLKGKQLIIKKNQAKIFKNRKIFFDLLKSLLLTYIFWTIFFSNLIYAHDYTTIFIIPILFMGTIYIFQLYWNKFEDLINQNHLANMNTKSGYIDLVKLKKVLIPLSLIFLVFYFFISVKIFANHSLSKASNRDKLELSKFFKEVDLHNESLSSKENLFVKFDKSWMPGSPYAMCSLINNFLYTEESKLPPDFASTNVPKLNTNRISKRISIKNQTYKFLKKYIKNL